MMRPDQEATDIFHADHMPISEQQLSPEKLYPPRLASQVERFINDLEAANQQKPEHAKRDPRNFAYLRDFFPRLFAERNTRTYDVESPNYQETVALANKQFPVKTYWNLCMDGRVLSVLTNGASSGIGTSMRVPGAMHREFVRGEDGKIFLRKDSTFAGLLNNGLKKSDGNAIAEVFDSHVGCAARKGEENQAGKHPSDNGLMADVLSKKEMAEATTRFVQNEFGDKKRVIPIQTSFDPHNGYMYMGLETDRALALTARFAQRQASENGAPAEKVKPEYTDEALQNLVKERAIISTEHLISDPVIRDAFAEHGNFTIDWRHAYVESAQHFWQGIASMRESLLPHISNTVREIFPNADTLEVEERAILLLTNAFNGYLNNKTEGGYSYDEHTEQFIKIYEGGQPPYDISAFVLNPDLKDLPANIELAASIVRANRLEGRVRDASENFTDPAEFREAVVPIVMQEIVREDVTEEDWEEFAAIDWYDEVLPIPKDWDTMTDEKFFEFLDQKANFSLGVARGINNLRRRMAVLYNPDLPTASRLIEQYKMALPTISGKNRRNYFVVPFVKTGFSE